MRDGGGCTAYVLSESSLFVFDQRIILKTCGTTTPLLVLDALAELMIDGSVTSCPGDSKASRGSASFAWLVDLLAFTHIDYRFPQRQKYPHRSFSEEVTFIQSRFPTAEEFRLPTTSDGQFHLVVWGNEESMRSGYLCESLSIDEVMMIGINEQSCERFAGDRPFEASDSEPWKSDRTSEESFGLSACSSEECSLSGFSSKHPQSVFKELLPKKGVQADQFWFTPCGYSCNAVCNSDFFSAHISPEPESSYASVETSIPFQHVSSAHFRHRIVETFQPAELHVLQILLTQGVPPNDLSNVIISSEGNNLVLRQCMQFVGSFYHVQHGYYSRDIATP